MVKRSDDTERRIHVLPTELLKRVRAYQSDNGIVSEVEAVRRLLDLALQMRDTFDDIMIKLRNKYAEEKDLRALARDILWSHPHIKGVRFDDDAMSFDYKNGDSGRVDSKGNFYIHREHDGYDEWHPYVFADERERLGSKKGRTKATGWNADMDDEIPF